MAISSRKSGSIGPADSALEQIELDLLLEAVFRRYGYDFRDYEPGAVRRRIRECMLAERISSISRLQGRLLREPGLFERFLRRFSSTRHSMFSDAALFKAFRTRALPMLRTYPFIRIWHAGCSTGEEVYAMAIMIEEEGLYSRCRIYATDLSEEAVAQARTGRYPAASFDEFASNYERAGGRKSLSAYVRRTGNRLAMKASLKKNIVFSEHNLTTDGSFNEFQVIICRDVLATFNPSVRERVDRLIYDSLARFGVLVLGALDSLALLPHHQCYAALDESTQLYQKVGFLTDSKAC